MIGIKIADKITSVGKTKSKEKENERQEIYVPPEKRQQIINDLRLFLHHIKMESQKITNLLDTAPDKVSRFITKKWVEAHDQSSSTEDRYKPSKQIIFKTSMIRSTYFSDAYIVVKGKVAANVNAGINYGAVDFPDELFPTFFLMEALLDQYILLELLLKQLLLMMQIVMIQEILSKAFFSKTMLHLLVTFQRLMAY